MKERFRPLLFASWPAPTCLILSLSNDGARAKGISNAPAQARSLPESLAALLTLALSAFSSATLLPGTSEAVLVTMHVAGSAPGWMLLAVASIANIAGSCVNWAMGRFLAHYAGRRWFPASPAQIERAQRWYARYGWPSLLASWVPVVGDPLTVVAGFLRTPFWLFVIVVAFAKTARYAALLWLIDLI